MPRLLAMNPLIRITPGTRATPFILEVLDRHQQFAVTHRVLRVLLSCTQPQHSQRILEKLANGVGRAKAVSALEQLTSAEVLVSPARAKATRQRYEQWFRYGWIDALHYVLRSSEINYVDRHGIGPQDVVLQEYLAVRPPDVRKSYPANRRVALPTPSCVPAPDLLTALLARRTHRLFSKAITLQELSDVMAVGCQELVAVRENYLAEIGQRPRVLVESLFVALELYLIVVDVAGLPIGTYHYDWQDHALHELQRGDFAKSLVSVTQGQAFVGQAAVSIIITAVIDRFMYRYRHPAAYVPVQRKRDS